MVVPYQNIVKHRLMSLRGEGGGEGSAEDICRGAVLICTLGLTFPLQRGEPLAKAAADLARIMSSSNMIQNSHFLFWAAMLGAVVIGAGEKATAAIDEGTEGAELRLRAERGLTTWDAAKATLKRFLWLDIACDEAAWKV
ncbi:uncharacterized protein PG986_005883 [Apiospora aurea]|uniref:Uncharacterized protein n=1 Tax=Apiospora aurea TaxID=335848 RepID=A0ABR1QIT9_9PEZI